MMCRGRRDQSTTKAISTGTNNDAANVTANATVNGIKKGPTNVTANDSSADILDAIEHDTKAILARIDARLVGFERLSLAGLGRSETPALAAWRRELAVGKRTATTVDWLFHAACWEASAAEYLLAGAHRAARLCRDRARDIVAAARSAGGLVVHGDSHRDVHEDVHEDVHHDAHGNSDAGVGVDVHPEGVAPRSDVMRRARAARERLAAERGGP